MTAATVRSPLFGGETTLHFGAGSENYVLLPIIPAA